MGTIYDTTDSDLEHFLSKTLFGDDVFAGEDWKENLCEDVGYDQIYSDKMSERCQKNKMLRKQETTKKPKTWNISWDPNNLRDRMIRCDGGKGERDFKSKNAEILAIIDWTWLLNKRRAHYTLRWFFFANSWVCCIGSITGSRTFFYFFSVRAQYIFVLTQCNTFMVTVIRFPSFFTKMFKFLIIQIKSSYSIEWSLYSFCSFLKKLIKMLTSLNNSGGSNFWCEKNYTSLFCICTTS